MDGERPTTASESGDEHEPMQDDHDDDDDLQYDDDGSALRRGAGLVRRISGGS